jgi:threonine synthase
VQRSTTCSKAFVVSYNTLPHPAYLPSFCPAQPYNFERIAYFVTECNCSLVKEWMAVMEQTHQLTLEPDWQARFRLDFDSASVTDDEMCHVLRIGSATLNYVADPHTAVAMAAAEKLGYKFTTESSAGQIIPMVIIATASPCKFKEAVTVALGQDGWNCWKEKNFPVRAQKTIQMKEVEPFLYPWTEGASLKDVQSLWRQMMLDIVSNNF